MQNADPHSIRVNYTRSSQGGARTATFDDGKSVSITASRARAYPGLPSEAPYTMALYKVATRVLPRDARVVDIGCGAGLGTRVLAEAMKQVVGVDVAEEAVFFSKRVVSGCENATIERADANEGLPESTYDAAVCIDVLAHLASPLDALVSIASQKEKGALLFVGEQAAHPEQCLASPVRRAFTKRTLASLLLTAGFAVETWHCEGSFLACTARVIDDDSVRAFAAAARTTSVPWALSLFGEAGKSTRADVMLEALLGRANLLLAGGEAEAACKLWFEARELSPEDPRATVGLARISLATGQKADAKTFAEMAIRADGGNADAHALLAQAKESLGENPGTVIHSWRAAANLAPDCVVFADKLVDAAIRVGDVKRAVFAAERLRAYERTNTGETCNAQIVYAKALLADGRESDARYELQIARGESKDNAWAEGVLNELRNFLGVGSS